MTREFALSAAKANISAINTRPGATLEERCEDLLAISEYLDELQEQLDELLEQLDAELEL